MSSKSSSSMLYIYVALGLLVIDAAIEMGFVTSMVAYLHIPGTGPFAVRDADGNIIMVFGVPANAILNQGHTSNGAAGTAVVLLGIGGVLALWLENRARRMSSKSSPIFLAWCVSTILSWLLTFTALVYTNVVTSQTNGQTIDLSVVAADPGAPYPLLQWTPENWYKAFLQLPLVNQSDIDTITQHLHIMEGWRYNLIPMFILGFVLMDFVILEVLRLRRTGVAYSAAGTDPYYDVTQTPKESVSV